MLISRGPGWQISAPTSAKRKGTGVERPTLFEKRLKTTPLKASGFSRKKRGGPVQPALGAQIAAAPAEYAFTVRGSDEDFRKELLWAWTYVY